jgi:DNA-binding MarR family transcriptional regulator
MGKKNSTSARKRRPAASNGQDELVSPLANSPGFLFRLAQIRAFDGFHRYFAGLGVTPTSFSVFALIVANPGIRPGAIADELHVKPSNVAALVNALVASELVVRRRDAGEPRASRLHPTKAGSKAHREMFRVHLETDALLLKHLTEAEGTKLVLLLQKLLQR